ncbi:hypothetical protein FQA39_LY03073 [Lamprigera yunnana]|nr:hypothetical protein FQA39_LY03073 [Lamprigera yunnana]
MLLFSACAGRMRSKRTTTLALYCSSESKLRKQDKCEAEPKSSQRETESVTQLNTYATSLTEVATGKLETTADISKTAVEMLNDDTSSTDAARELNVTMIPTDDAELDKTREEKPEQNTATVKEGSRAKAESNKGTTSPKRPL